MEVGESQKCRGEIIARVRWVKLIAKNEKHSKPLEALAMTY